MEPRLAHSRRHPNKKRRPTTITVPERAGPHVKLVFTEMRRQGVTYDEVEEGSGVLRTTVKAWRHHNYPGLMSMEAVLGYLGWSFVPLPSERVLPPEVIEELRPVADRLGLTMPSTIEALAAIVAGIHAKSESRAAA